VLKHVLDEFFEVLRAQPDELSTRLVMADLLDERGRHDEAAAWRWSAEKRLCPVFVDDALIERTGVGWREQWKDRWNWMGIGFERDPYPLEVYAASINLGKARGLPHPRVREADCPVVLLNELVDWYLDLDAGDRALADNIPVRTK
jgi:uncharacterized protein (TIGR02996 family)